MKWSLRAKWGRVTFFSMLSLTQTVSGITSLVKNVGNVRDNKHILMWDLENVSFYNVIGELTGIQEEYKLGEIFIFGDKEGGKTFNAICFTQVKFKELLEILTRTNYLDYLFFKYTVIRGKATIRLTKKRGRGKQRVLHTITGRAELIPKEMEKVIYDTGLTKMGKLLELIRK